MHSSCKSGRPAQISLSISAIPRWQRVHDGSARALCFQLDRKYSDVGILRWQSLSGKQATLDGDDRIFEQQPG
jgi:hypothetical protein